MKYLYETEFNLLAHVNDFDEASRYLTEDDMTVYLKEDDRIPVEVRNAVCKIEWELTDTNCGTINLITTRKMNEEELKYISDYVSGQNSDGLGEGFEQQDFAEEFDEEAFNDAHDDFQSEYDEYVDEFEILDDDEKADYEDEYEYASSKMACVASEPLENDYKIMASFDWKENDYTFSFIGTLEKERDDWER